MFIHTIHYSFYQLKQFLILHLFLFLDFISVLSRLNVTRCDTHWGDNSNTLVTVRCYKFIMKRLSYRLVIDFVSVYVVLCRQLRSRHVCFAWRLACCHVCDVVGDVMCDDVWRPICHLSDIFITFWRWRIVRCVFVTLLVMYVSMCDGWCDVLFMFHVYHISIYLIYRNTLTMM